MKFQVLNRWTNNVLFEADIDCDEGASRSVKLGLAVKWALENHADLTGANLTRANLTRANLIDANLTRANLTDANLIRANLTRANLTRANLTRANLIDANLTRANLTGADLTGANLIGANLIGANLTRADLTDANLTVIRNDFWDVLLRARQDVPGLLSALRSGRINGSGYEGECACLMGTIANIRGKSYRCLGNGLEPQSSRPIERLFLGIKKGDTPDNSPLAKIIEGWIIDFLRWTAA